MTQLPLATGQKTPLIFGCPLSSNALGTKFSGYLWIQYNDQLQSNNINNIAIVTAVASSTQSESATASTTSTTSTTSTSTTSTTTTSIHYVPITLTNSQGSGTGSGFQQQVSVNSNAYSTYINSPWNNVEFTTGPSATGTVLQGWIESAASNTASNTVVWLNLPSTIGADSNTVVYMNFMPINVLSSGGPTGEAPSLSGTYGQYDNGGRVFPYYQPWGGLSSLPSGWVNAASGSALTYYPSYTQITSAGPSHAYVNYSGAPFSSMSAPFTIDWYGDMYECTGTTIYTGVQSATSYSIIGENNCPAPFVEATGITYTQVGGEGGSGNKVYTNMWYTSTSYKFMIGYSSIASGTVATPVGSMTKFVLSGGSYSGNPPINVYWLRTRVTPPSGVMPSVSFGSFV